MDVYCELLFSYFLRSFVLKNCIPSDDLPYFQAYEELMHAFYKRNKVYTLTYLFIVFWCPLVLEIEVFSLSPFLCNYKPRLLVYAIIQLILLL